MKYLFTATILLFSFCSFGQKDTTNPLKGITDEIQRIYQSTCKHTYVAVEPDTISLATGTVSLKIVTDEGQEIVCIKCFYKRKQHVKQMEQAEPWRAWGPFFQKNGGGCFLPNQLPQKDKRLTLEVREQQ